MAAAYRSSSKTAWGNQATITVTKPTGTVDNDILVAIICTETLAAITGPAGWTKSLDFTTSVQNDLRVTIWTKVASSEGASWGWPAAGGPWCGGIVITVSGGDTTTPVDAIGTGDAGGFGGAMLASSISPTGSDSLLIYAGMDYSNTTPHAAPAGMSNQSGALDNVENLAFTQALSASGATGTRTPTVNATSTWGDVLIAIKSASAAVDTLWAQSVM